MKTNDLKPIAVHPHEGKILDSLGVQNKLTSQHTGSAIYLFESEFGPGNGNRLHVHRYEDEVAYVLQGAMAVRLGDQNLEIHTGGVAFLPKGIPHALRNPSTTSSRYLFAAIPGGYLEYWFEAIEAAEEGSLDDGAYQALSLKYGIEWLE